MHAHLQSSTVSVCHCHHRSAMRDSNASEGMLARTSSSSAIVSPGEAWCRECSHASPRPCSPVVLLSARLNQSYCNTLQLSVMKSTVTTEAFNIDGACFIATRTLKRLHQAAECMKGSGVTAERGVPTSETSQCFCLALCEPSLMPFAAG